MTTTKTKATVKSYLKPILARTHADLKIADGAAAAVDERLSAMIVNVVSDAKMYATVSRRKTIMTKDLEMTMKMTLKHEDAAATSITTAMTGALERYRSTGQDVKGSRSSRAGVAFPVSRIESQMRLAVAPLRLSEDVGVAMAAVAELCASVILDAAGAIAHEERKKILAPTHVAAAVERSGAWKLLTSAAGGHTVTSAAGGHTVTAAAGGHTATGAGNAE